MDHVSVVKDALSALQPLSNNGVRLILEERIVLCALLEDFALPRSSGVKVSPRREPSPRIISLERFLPLTLTLLLGIFISDVVIICTF